MFVENLINFLRYFDFDDLDENLNEIKREYGNLSNLNEIRDFIYTDTLLYFSNDEENEKYYIALELFSDIQSSGQFTFFNQKSELKYTRKYLPKFVIDWEKKVNNHEIFKNILGDADGVLWLNYESYYTLNLLDNLSFKFFYIEKIYSLDNEINFFEKRKEVSISELKTFFKSNLDYKKVWDFLEDIL